MAVLNSLRQALGALRRNPVLFAPILLLVVFQVPQLLLQAVNPLVASVVSMLLSLVFIVVMPFFQAGIVGMADEALDGRTSLGTFVSAGKSNYVSVLAAYLVLVAVNFAIGFAVFFGAIFGGFALFGAESGGPNLAILAVVGLFVLVLGLAYLVFVFLVQFYAQAIVIDDYGAVDGIRHSFGVVRNHLLSTFGYSVVVAVFGGVLGAIYGVASILLSPSASTAPASGMAAQQLSVGAAAGLSAILVVVGTLFGAFLGVYSVSFYRAIAHTDDASEAPAESPGETAE